MNHAFTLLLMIFLGVFTHFNVVLAQDTNSNQLIPNQNQQPSNLPPQVDSPTNEQPANAQPESMIAPAQQAAPAQQILTQDSPPEIPSEVPLVEDVQLENSVVQEDTAILNSASQFEVSSPWLYLLYTAVGIFVIFWFAWWRKWLKRRKKAPLTEKGEEQQPPTEAEKLEEKAKQPAEAERLVCPTCGGSGKITKKRKMSVPCGHCKASGLDMCHYCSGTGRDGLGYGVPLDDIENYPKCLYCQGKGTPEIPIVCCMCKGKRKQEYDESYEVTCPTCKGSGWIRNW